LPNGSYFSSTNGLSELIVGSGVNSDFNYNFSELEPRMAFIILF